MCKKFAISRYISNMLKSCETLERSPKGEAKHAYDTLVNLGAKALPALRAKKEQLIAEHQVYLEWLNSGASSNPYKNYSQKSDAEKRYRYVLEVKQARIIDLIEEIERTQ
jgi:hypothetical protein